MNQYALHIAVRTGILDMVKKSLYGVDINQKDGDGNTPLHLAVQFGFWEIATFLMRNGGRISIENNDGIRVMDMVHF